MTNKHTPLNLDDSLWCLTPEDFETLAEHHERERWIWEQVNKNSEEDFTWAVEHHRDMARNFKELSAELEREQEEWEMENKTRDKDKGKS